MSVQRFGRCALRPSSYISFRTREASCRNQDLPRNFEPNPLFDPQGVLCPRSAIHSWVQVLSCVNYYSMLLSPLKD